MNSYDTWLLIYCEADARKRGSVIYEDKKGIQYKVTLVTSAAFKCEGHLKDEWELMNVQILGVRTVRYVGKYKKIKSRYEI